jgi:hypothetical protein
MKLRASLKRKTGSCFSFKAKDAGVNRKRKPLTLYIIAMFVWAKQTTNKATKRLYNTKIVRNMIKEIGLQLTQVM